MKLCVTRPGQSSRARRGGGFLVLLLVAIPMALFGVSLAMDYGRSIWINRQITDTAEAVVMAGATGFNENVYGQLEPNEAQRRAREMYQQAVSVGMLQNTSSVTGMTTRMLNNNRTIRADFSVEVPLYLPSIVVGILGGDTNPFVIRTTIARQASVCLDSNRAGCMYPIDIR